MTPPRLGLSSDLFITAFPFHVAFDRDMRIVQAGRVLRRLCPKLSPGSPLHQLFEISRPRIQFTFEAIREQSQSLFILESLDTRLRLKGQMLPDDRRGVVFFLCSPWLTELAAAEALGLSLSDFAIHDPVADFLFLLQSKDSALSDLNRLAMKLRARSVELQKARSQLEARVQERTAELSSANTLLAREITERKRVEEALREQTRRDPLTGALNHAAIIHELRGVIAAVVDDATCAIAMVDVDGLKAVNDTYGHQVGDALLTSVGHAMSRRGAIVGRYGGDEFLAIIPSAGREEAERYRDEVAATLADARVTEAETGATVSVAASMGLAIYPEDGRTAHELLDLSDSAMYASRRQRPVGPGELSPSRTLGGERAAAMVGQLIPLLTASGTIEDKLRLVAHRLSVGAGYDAVNVDVFAHAYGLPTARNTFSRVPDELVDAWQSEQRRMEDEPILRHIKSTRRALIVEDPQNDERLTEGQLAVLRAAELCSAVVVPLFWEDEMIGVLSVASKRKAAFTAEDIEFLTAVATQITSVVRMTTLFEELQSTSHNLAQAREDAVLLLAAASEAHDATTGQHLRAVRGLTEALALDLSHDEESARELGMAAVLHDIGKIHVPDHVLSAPGKLTSEQWQGLIRHTVWGAEFLENHAGFELAATVARSHHERWDGTGYPDALSGDDIPEGATIVAVADAFDAITSERPYKDSRPIDEAVQEIRAFSGKQFSPRVVAALSRLYEQGKLGGEKRLATIEQAA